MRYKMVYIFFMLFLLITIPYVITVFLEDQDKNLQFETYDSGYHILSGNKNIDLETYLLNILPSQISTDQEEALKAQAIILRTDVRRRMGNNNTIQQEELPYLAYQDTQYKQKLGKREYQLMDQKRKKAVSETCGKVITYKNQLIEPYFHALSVGFTLDSREWFKKDLPYIREKESLCDIEAKGYMNVKILDYDTIVHTIKKYTKKSFEKETIKKKLKVGNTTKNGYVRQVYIDTLSIKGENFAKWFHLASNNFYFEEYKGKIRIICLGKGNGLGLSQYGAEKMAEQGRTYQKILKYYYPNTTIKNLYE